MAAKKQVLNTFGTYFILHRMQVPGSRGIQTTAVLGHFFFHSPTKDAFSFISLSGHSPDMLLCP